jgi:hypothetical protein
LILPRPAGFLVVAISVGELAGEEALQYFGLILGVGGLGVGRTADVSQVSGLSLKILIGVVGFFGVGRALARSLLLSGDGLVVLPLPVVMVPGV